MVDLTESRAKAVARATAWVANNRERRRAYVRSLNKPVLERACLVCQSIFSSSRPKKYCSISCRDKAFHLRNPDKRREDYAKKAERAVAAATVRQMKSRHLTPWARLISAAKIRAKRKNIPFSLDNSWGRRRWTGRCELSGLNFVLGQKRNVFSPSIDQVSPGAGYTPDNCRFVLWGLNTFKGRETDDTIHAIVDAVVAFRGRTSISPVGIGDSAGPGVI